MPTATVDVDFLPTSAFRYVDHDAIVAIDVLLTTTTLVTAAAQGRSAFVAPGLEEAAALERRLGDVLLATEPGAEAGAERLASTQRVPNSPARLASRTDVHRPLVLLGGYGAQLLENARSGPTVYVSCLRNLAATADEVARRHRRIAILGAGASGRPRCEDQMAAARLAQELLERGVEPAGVTTSDLIERWGSAQISLTRLGSSAEMLKLRGRDEDVDFVLAHQDDIAFACTYDGTTGGRGAALVTQPRLAAPIERMRAG